MSGQPTSSLESNIRLTIKAVACILPLSSKDQGKSLESLLRRYVYGQPLRLKSDPNLRKPVIAIVDRFFDAASPAEHRIRDDFVTPMSYTKGSC